MVASLGDRCLACRVASGWDRARSRRFPNGRFTCGFLEMIDRFVNIHISCIDISLLPALTPFSPLLLWPLFCSSQQLEPSPVHMQLICSRALVGTAVQREKAYGVSLLGSRGKNVARRTFGKPKKSMTTRSRPTPPPPCGYDPCLKQSTYP